MPQYLGTNKSKTPSLDDVKYDDAKGHNCSGREEALLRAHNQGRLVELLDKEKKEQIENSVGSLG